MKFLFFLSILLVLPGYSQDKKTAEKQFDSLLKVKTDNFQQKIETYKEALKKAENLGELELSYLITRRLGRTYKRIGLDLMSLNHYQRAMVIAKEVNDLEFIQESEFNLGREYIDIEKYANAEELFFNGLERTKNDNKSSITYDESYYYHYLGYLYLNKKNLKLAKKYLDSSLFLIHDHPSRLSQIYDDYANFYRNKSKKDSSLYYQRKSYEIAKKISNQSSRRRTTKRSGVYFLQKESFPLRERIDILDYLLNTINKNSIDKYDLYIYNELSYSYSKLKNVKKRDSFKVIYDTLNSNYLRFKKIENKEIAELVSSLKEKEIILKNENVKKKRTIREKTNQIIIIAFIALGLCLFMYFVYRNYLKKKDDKLKNYIKDLISMSLDRRRNYNYLEGTLKSLKDIDLSDIKETSVKQDVLFLKSSLIRQVELNKDQETKIIGDPEKVDFNFMLDKIYPGLTISEKQLCGFIKIDLSYKEIAEQMNIRKKTLEMRIFRLRKKFGFSTIKDFKDKIKNIEGVN